jgi:NADH-quinone oxidoreductase subunit L
MPHTLALIALLPLVGFLFNGFFATALGRHRTNERAAGIIGSAFPIAAFALTIKAFYGAYKSGIRCSGGQCRVLPGFEGARVSLVASF